jgi:hypothetical protein
LLLLLLLLLLMRQVVEAGRYEVVLMYTSRALATFELAVGPLADIKDGAAPAILAQLPAMVRMLHVTVVCTAPFLVQMWHVTPLLLLQPLYI